MIFTTGIVKGQEFLSFKVYPSNNSYSQSDEIKVAAEIQINKPYHIYPYKVNDPAYIPTAINVNSDLFEISDYFFPEYELYKFEFSETELWVYQGDVHVGLNLKSKGNLKSGNYFIPVSIYFQACDDKVCYPPKTVIDTVEISITEKTGDKTNDDIFAQINFSKPTQIKKEKVNLSENERISAPPGETQVSDFIAENGLFLSIFFIFLGGLALNLTPCVYPLIPITISYFGVQASGSKAQSILMGVFYALGMSVTYSALGLFAALSGSLLGTALQNPLVIIFVASVLFALGTSMFGAFEIRVPQKLALAGNKNRSGLFGSMVMGLLVGFIAAPCIGPFVLGLVTYVATKQDPYFGFLLFFVLAVGLGIPYLFLAIFSGKIKKLPRAGEWMDAVKHIFGFILIGMALYFLLPLLPKSISGYVLPVFMIGAAIYLLFFEKLANSVKGFRIFKIAFSIIIMAVGVYALIPSESNSVSWEPFSESALDEISGRGVIIDFYADWCIPCKELDALTFSDSKVISLSKEFETYKADMTKALSPEVEMLREQFKIVGVPTVLILNSKGEEVERITGFVNAGEFYKMIEVVN